VKPLLPLVFLIAASVLEAQPYPTLPAVTVNASKEPVVLWTDSATHAEHFQGGETFTLDSLPYRAADAASIGDASLAVWLRDDRVYAQLIEEHPIGSPVTAGVADLRSLAVAAAASRDSYLVAWDVVTGIHGSIIDRNGNVIVSDLTLVNGSPYITGVVAASIGDQFLVVWEEQPSAPCRTCPPDHPTIRAVIVDSLGNTKPESEMVLASPATLPDVATDGRSYFVIWTSLAGGGVQGVHVTPGLSGAGETISLERPPYALSAGAAKIAWDGYAWLVTQNVDIQARQYQIPAVTVDRYSNDGRHISSVLPGNVIGLQPTDYAIAARDGYLANVFTNPSGVHVETGLVGVLLPPRVRAVRRW